MKRLLLGPSLGTAQLQEEKLSRKAALGVLSSDCISSSAYGTEEMLIVLLGVFGLAGFRILMPLTVVVLVVLALMTLLYREVVMVYTKAAVSSLRDRTVDFTAEDQAELLPRRTSH